MRGKDKHTKYAPNSAVTPLFEESATAANESVRNAGCGRANETNTRVVTQTSCGALENPIQLKYLNHGAILGHNFAQRLIVDDYKSIREVLREYVSSLNNSPLDSSERVRICPA